MSVSTPISNAPRLSRSPAVYLIDTNVISKARKARANPGVLAFFDAVDTANEPIYLSVMTIGELRRGVELIRDRGDLDQRDQKPAYRHQIAVKL
jgi:predicted nucleic acid-binding protein